MRGRVISLLESFCVVKKEDGGVRFCRLGSALMGACVAYSCPPASDHYLRYVGSLNFAQVNICTTETAHSTDQSIVSPSELFIILCDKSQILVKLLLKCGYKCSITGGLNAAQLDSRGELKRCFTMFR